MYSLNAGSIESKVYNRRVCVNEEEQQKHTDFKLWNIRKKYMIKVSDWLIPYRD